MACVALVAVPLLRKARSQGAPAPAAWTALGAAGVLVIGSVLLYVLWSNWSWHAPPPDDSPAEHGGASGARTSRAIPTTSRAG